LKKLKRLKKATLNAAETDCVLIANTKSSATPNKNALGRK
jgi:hypothetical protein